MKKYWIVGVWLLSSLPLLAQEDEGTQLHLYGKNIDGKLHLRWAIAPAMAWEQSLHYGYRLQRIEILRDGISCDTPRVEELSPAGIFPLDSSFWKSRMDDEDSYALLAQALFGQSFTVDFSSSSWVSRAQQQQEKELRHGIALLAADRHFAAACAAGMGWVDSSYSSKSTYLYKLIAQIPDSILHADTATLLRFARQEDPLPDIPNFTAEVKENLVHLSWNQTRFSSAYRDYVVERSTNPRHFLPAHSHPLALTADDKGRYHWIDTLPAHGSPVYYRIYGQDLFGQSGPFSPIKKCLPKAQTHSYPEDLHILDDGKRRSLHWSFDSAAREHLLGFRLLRAPSFGGKNDTLFPLISPHKNSQRLPTSPYPSQYYTLVALYTSGDKRYSESCFLQDDDSIAPTPPFGGKALVDSLGIVAISWSDNPENDLQGYRVFRRLSPSAEAVQISNTLVTNTLFSDTLSLSSDENVYYQISACDKRGNESKLSPLIEAQRPWTFAPTSPQILAAEIRQDKIFLRWVNSSSHNARQTLLLQEDHPNTWTLVKRLPADSPYDSLILPIPNRKTQMRYALQSEGSNGLLSPLSEPASLCYIRTLQTPIFHAHVDRKNQWVHLAWIPRSDFPYREIQIFRQSPGERLLLLRVLPGKEKDYKDKQLHLNTRYAYYIRVIDEEGQRSSLSKGLEVEY